MISKAVARELQTDLRGKDKSGHNEILPWSLTEQMCREDQQRVKPASSLVDTLGDEVRRECTLE